MKILIITQWFDPEPTFKGLLFAKKLSDEGNEVEVVTGFPNYPGGKIYEGYKMKPYETQEIEGVKVHRVALYPSHDSSGLKRALNYISFGISSFIFSLIKIRKADVIYAYHPPLTTSIFACFIGKIKRTPVVLDIQDLWPDTLKATGMLNNRTALKIASWFCNITYKLSNHIVVLSPGFKKRLVERGVRNDKIDVIYNWSDEKNLNRIFIEKTKLPRDAFNIVFAGNLGVAQGLPSIIDAAKLLDEKNIAINIIFVGSGIAKKASTKKVKEESISNVIFIPRVPMSEIGGILSQADALLVHLIKDELFSITIPSKLQTYMSIGKPIIIGVEGDAQELVAQSRCGLICESDNPSSIAECFERMAKMENIELQNMGNNAKNHYDEKLSLSVGVAKFLDVFKRVQK